MEIIWVLLAVIALMVVSAIPLHFAVVLLKGKSSILKVIFINFVVGLLGGVLQLRYGVLGNLVGFLVLLMVYAVMFKLTFLRAFLAWLLQFIVAAVLLLLLVLSGLVAGNLASFI